jgi:tetratricopeptide (TPR) repeat protein
METPSWLLPALGYLDLKMFEETWKALDELPEEQRNSLEALKIRVTCRLDEERYAEALELCREMCQRFPEEHTGFIQGAFCLHEMERTPEAQDWLQSGPQSLQVEATYFYNLGCYDLALGKVESACAWLIQAFEMEPSYHEDALKDPDFKPIFDRIAEMGEDDDDDYLT